MLTLRPQHINRMVELITNNVSEIDVEETNLDNVICLRYGHTTELVNDKGNVHTVDDGTNS